MHYSLKKNCHYIIEWIDPIHLVADADPNDVKERITTYGKYLGETEGILYLTTLTKEEDNTVKIPTKCVMSVVEVNEGGFGSIFCLLMFFVMCTSLYFTFSPPQFVINNLIDEIDKHYSIIIQDNGTSN